MKKKIVNSILARAAMLLALLTMAPNVAATVNSTVSNWNDLLNQLYQTDENAPDLIQLTADVTEYGNGDLTVPPGRSVTLDLNGHTVTMQNNMLIIVGNLILMDTSVDESGCITRTSGPCVYVGTNSQYPGTMTLVSGKISGTVNAISVAAGSSLTINGGKVSATEYYAISNRGSCVMNGGMVSAPNWVVINRNCFVLDGGMVNATGNDDGKAVGILTLKDSEVTIYDGTITAYSFAIMGNYATSGNFDGSNAKFTIDGGTLTSTNSTVIYAPQASGEVIITGGTITGARSGVFLLSGTLNIQGGTIKGNTQTYDTSDADNGVIGSAVTVAQYTTKQNINVNITGGTLIGYLPLSEHNIYNSTEEDLRKINYNISGGLFHSTGSETINIEDYLNGPFAVGGRFTHSVAQYVASGYFEFQDSNADPIYVCLPYLADGMNYLQTSDSDVDVATYTKTLGAERIGKHQAWFVPFDYTITSADEAKFTFYKINMIANSPDPSVEASNEVWVFLTKLSADDVLHANMPYVYKPKEAVTDYPFTSNNVTLKAKNTGVIADTRTLEDIYSFYGTYENTTPAASDPFYYVGIDGNLSLGNNGSVTVGPYRWILRKTSKYGGTSSYSPKVRFFDPEEDDVTGVASVVNENDNENVYDLSGRRINGQWSMVNGQLPKGIYIVNGRKVFIK